MDRLPVEILTGIAAELLSTRDVCNFRLCSPRCSSAGFPVLFRQIHVMNTVDCLEEAKILHASSAGSSRVTKHLTIHHGSWPEAESLRIWSTHPLRHGHAAESNLGMTCAFRDYRAFVQREASRTSSSDADRFLALFELFPNVSSVTISHVYHWDKGKLTNAQFTRLMSTFRIVPRFEGCVNSAVSSILPVLQRRPLVRDVTIRGLFDPSTTKCINLPSVTRLRIQSLTYPTRREDVHQFLASFPSLEELNLSGNSAGPLFGQGLPLQGVQCPKLTRVEFTNFCTSEDELVDFVQQHGRLRLLVLEKVILYMGREASQAFASQGAQGDDDHT
ncbi:hypothetical protein SPBR_06021 [Sporothrix brasiliensis 5110]|uniref:F-box domain-containing protein n=1 Tax=Sporothrix brasiliensis 5110 TaxID=1398154 RepID=A0A0C2JBJ6_9PEZI|nr:uncharacterized protein SPBR_06021 [Sporothrix brasiliensis 5110]KIH94242.1 hypothetical protein SPBR_06021 [Sporothrix brasiliensis 5110]